MGKRMAHAEDGFALVSAMLVLLVLILLGTAVAAGTTSGVRLSQRAKYDTQALQAAEAGADIAWNRINTTQSSLTLTAAKPCASWDSAGNVTTVAAASTAGSTYWCPPVSVPLSTSGSVTYQVGASTTSPYKPQYLVGTAAVGTVTRRVKLALNAAATPSSLFGTYAVESAQALDFQNQSQITGSVRSDKSITLEGSYNGCHVSGDTIPGSGFTTSTTNGTSTCGQTVSDGKTISWPAISDPGSDNDSQIAGGGDIIWSSANKTLTIQNNATLTLTGNTYRFCNLNIENGTLDLAPANGQPVQIYMLSPTSPSCSGAGISAGSQTFTFQNNNAYIKNDTGKAAQGVQVYMLGATTAYLNNSSSYQFNGVIYAPNDPGNGKTAVQVINAAAMKGAIAAYSMVWTAQASLTYDSTAQNVTYASGSSSTYTQNQYRECSPAPGAGNAPDTGC